MRVAGPSVLSHVSVKNMQSILLLIRNVLFQRDLTFKSAIFRVTVKVLLRDGLAAGCLCVHRVLRLFKFTPWVCLVLCLVVIMTGIIEELGVSLYLLGVDDTDQLGSSTPVTSFVLFCWWWILTLYLSLANSIDARWNLQRGFLGSIPIALFRVSKAASDFFNACCTC